jgi:asparagine synthase (glutamine-hydrolysing)
MGHTRLSIIDLSGGDQPIHNEDRSIWIIFNGEIFNYPELRRELVKKGHLFYTQSDTEVLIHLYEEYGENLFLHINGQFAFAIWDRNLGTFMLARDRMGIRPLFYHQKDQRLFFASEIKSLLAVEDIQANLDPQTLADIFTCWSPVGTMSPFRGIYQLPPGHYAIFGPDGMSTKRYWRIDFAEAADSDRSLESYVEEFSALMLDAARIRLRADVPVGAYLSGGIDSTFISTLIKRNFNNRLNTFSVSFSDERFDESNYQKTAVGALGTEHKSIRCSETDIGRIFPEVVWHTETPILRTAPAPLYLLSGLVRASDFKVVLTGEGADEILAGYNIFKEDRIRRFWARQPESNLRPGLLKRLYPYIFDQSDSKSEVFLKAFFKKNLSAVSSPVYSHMLRWQNTGQLKNLFSPQIKEQLEGQDSLESRFTADLPRDFMDWNPLSRAQYIESSLFLANYLLCSQGDRMAMANSVEGRFPFLDHRVVELAARMPPRLRMNGLTEKYILKQAAQGLIPKTLVKRSKQPYRAPISRCFFSAAAPDYVDEMLSKEAITQKAYFDWKRVSRLISKCRKQKGSLLSERENMALVGILSTQLLDHLFIRDYPGGRERPFKEVKRFEV